MIICYHIPDNEILPQPLSLFHLGGLTFCRIRLHLEDKRQTNIYIFIYIYKRKKKDDIMLKAC